MTMSTESKCRALLVRLSCDKLIKVRRSPDVLRRQIQILSVLKHAHDENARFEPECSYLLEKQRAPRLVVTFEQAPIQRIRTPSTSSSPSSSSTASTTSDREVPTSPAMEQVEFDEQEIIEEDGGSMARKRKNHSNVDAVSSEKRHCDKESSSSASSHASCSNNSF